MNPIIYLEHIRKEHEYYYPKYLLKFAHFKES